MLLDRFFLFLLSLYDHCDEKWMRDWSYSLHIPTFNAQLQRDEKLGSNAFFFYSASINFVVHLASIVNLAPIANSAPTDFNYWLDSH